MKRILAFLIVWIMVLAMVGCQQQEKAASAESGKTYHLDHKTFSVGYARVDISPELSVPMAGFGNTTDRMSQNIQDYLFATATAVNDGCGNTVVFVSLDLQRASDVIVEAMRPWFVEETGLPESSLQIIGTHTHSGPDVQAVHEASSAYLSSIIPKLQNVILGSLADLRPATMSVGSIEAEGLNFVRHYGHTEADGSVSWFGDNFGTSVLDENTFHASKADPTMYVIKFDRQDAKDVCMVNWRAHPHWTGSASKYDISSDWVGPFRECFEAQTDMYFAYYQGAAGNINEKSRITSENLVSDYQEHGARLADYAVKCLNENMEDVEAGALEIREQTLEMQINKTKDAGLINAATIYRSVYKNTNSREEAKKAALELGYSISSQYAAGAIITNSQKEDTEQRTYSVIAIGKDLVITLAPHEMFDRTMAGVEEASSYKYTLHFSYSNGTNTYMPDLQNWATGSYEVDTAVFVEGSAELVAETMLKMMNEMYND